MSQMSPHLLCSFRKGPTVNKLKYREALTRPCVSRVTNGDSVSNDGRLMTVPLLIFYHCYLLDVELQPDPFPAISFNVIGGILDFFIFMGPTPENVVQQYTEVMGHKMLMWPSFLIVH